MRKRGSLSGWLTLWFVVSSFFFVSIAIGTLYWSLTSALSREDTLFVSDKTQAISHLLEDSSSLQRLKDRVEGDWAQRQADRIFVRVTDDKGVIVAETPGFRSFYRILFTSETTEQGYLPESIATKRDEHSGFVFKTKTVRLVAASRHWTLQIALDRTSEEHLLEAYRSRLFLVLVSTLLVAAFIGRRLVQRGMRPVYDMAESARRIRSTTLHERLKVENLPSELVVLAVTFNEMLDRLNESFERLSQFSADIAHDLRTPVNNLRGELEVALGKARSPEEYRDVLGSCLEECQRITHLIDSLLFLARAENPKLKLRKEKLDLSQEIDAVREFFEASASEKGVHLQLEASEKLSIVGDRVLFQRALGNLISNALNYTPEGGTISVSVHETADSLGVSVQDTGVGIPKEHLPHVFDRFYRVDQARSGKTGGTGLGLSIVKSIMALHQGKAEISSEAGRGTKVTLFFPKA